MGTDFNVQGSVHRRYISKYNQQDATLHSSFLCNALHVSDGTSAHHQELKTVYTVSDICPTFTAAYRQAAINV
jgi:hypothetical protein